MPMRAKKVLGDKQVQNLREPGWYNVGGVPGLLLQVTGTVDQKTGGPRIGGRSWVLRATIAGRVRMAGLGPFPEVSLATAREKAREMRQAIREGRDPIEERRKVRREQQEEVRRRMKFKDAAIKYHAIKSRELGSQGHIRDWIGCLERFAFPIVGDLRVGEVTRKDVLRVLEPIWETKSGGTAQNVRQRIAAVFDWAIENEYLQGDNPARAENFKHSLVAVHEVKPRKALPWKQCPAFVQELRRRLDPVSRCLLFTILTATRSGAARLATRREFDDLDRRLWKIDAGREGSKIRKPRPGRRRPVWHHHVTLSGEAVQVVRDQWADQDDDEDYVFAIGPGSPVRDEQLVMLAREISGDPKLTVHGFRSSFKDWAREEHGTRFADEVSELCLWHVNSDATWTAYGRSELLELRFRMLEMWAGFLRGEEIAEVEVKSGRVVPIGQTTG